MEHGQKSESRLGAGTIADPMVQPLQLFHRDVLPQGHVAKEAYTFTSSDGGELVDHRLQVQIANLLVITCSFDTGHWMSCSAPFMLVPAVIIAYSMSEEKWCLHDCKRRQSPLTPEEVVQMVGELIHKGAPAEQAITWPQPLSLLQAVL
jgi:hypothetical protein